MHEFGLIRDLFKKINDIATQEKASIVTKVHVELGALAHISSEHFREHFDELRNTSKAKDAELIITENPDQNSPYAQEIRLLSIDVGE